MYPPFLEICIFSVHRSSRFVYLSVLEDDNRGNMIVHLDIDNKDETVVHSLTITNTLISLSVVVRVVSGEGIGY